MEIDDQGKMIRSGSSADPAFAGALLTPYGLVVLPELDRVVSTNSSMQLDDVFSGVTYQVWRLSDLKLLKTAYFDVGENRYAQISPEEPRVGPDGSIFVQTLGCSLERIAGVNTDEPKSQLVYTFPGNWCGVPAIVGHYRVQTAGATNGLIALDIANPAKPVEVSRLKLSDTYWAHWTASDPKTRRIVVIASVIPGQPAERLYLMNLDLATGTLTRCFSGHRWRNWLQLRESAMAAWMERFGPAPWSSLLALKTSISDCASSPGNAPQAHPDGLSAIGK